jgi:hypothetical protein
MDSIEIVEPVIFKISKLLLPSETYCSSDVVYTIEHRQGVPDQFVEMPPVLKDKLNVTTIEEFYDCFVARTAEQCALEASAPQRSHTWHMARKYCITASSFGSAIGNNKYSSPEMCAKEKLWSSFKGNEFTEYGSFHEKDAQESFLKNLKNLGPTLDDILPGYDSFSFHETGLLKSPDIPWLAVSPDGLLKLRSKDGKTAWALVEFKCPARLRHCTGHPYAKDNNVPRYYMDQIQGICGLLNEKPDILKMVDGAACAAITDIFFVVWQPQQVHITRLKYDHEYYAESLKPALENWYFKLFLPMAFLKHNGQLIENTLQVDTSK